MNRNILTLILCFALLLSFTMSVSAKSAKQTTPSIAVAETIQNNFVSDFAAAFVVVEKSNITRSFESFKLAIATNQTFTIRQIDRRVTKFPNRDSDALSNTRIKKFNLFTCASRASPAE